MSVLSLGLLLPFGMADRAVAVVQNAADQPPAKHVVLQRGTQREQLETRAETIDALLAERGIVRLPEDRLSSAPGAALLDGATVVYRPAVTVTLSVNGVSRQLRSAAPTVGAVLADEHIAVGARDRLVPAAVSAVAGDISIRLERVTSWLERFRSGITPPIMHKYDLGLSPGKVRVVDPGAPGSRETTLAVLQPDAAQAPRRLFLAARVLRLPRTRIVAEGVGDAVALNDIAHRGFVGTMRLADAALKMIATAYTAACSGCSGMTASGRPAGHGVVAVDPHIIPLGSHLFIPGYGHAFAGDTGGAIHGNRIDLGFDSQGDAMTFGRRAIVVYVLK